jgi:hypothetical protein
MRSPAYSIAWSLFTLLASPALETASAADSPIITEPHAGQVFQRDRNNRATVPVVLAPAEAAKVRSIELQPLGTRMEGNAFADVPTGGPYTLQISMMTDAGPAIASAGPFYVGDLWVLAG